MSIVVEKLDNRITNLVVDQDNLTYVLLADQPGGKQINIKLAKEGIEAKILGIFIGRQGEMIVRTTQHHVSSNATSDLLFKVVLLGNARFDYIGLIKIEPQAQGANAYQRNDNLVLHRQAQVETRPELEILANEVRCTHGATVGRLDEEQIYYLMSRGLKRGLAEQLLLSGFLGEITSRINNAVVRTEILNFISRSLKT